MKKSKKIRKNLKNKKIQIAKELINIINLIY